MGRNTGTVSKALLQKPTRYWVERIVGVTNLVSVTEQSAADYGGLLASKDINTNHAHIITNYVYSITDDMHTSTNYEPFALLPTSYLSPEYIITSICERQNICAHIYQYIVTILWTKFLLCHYDPGKPP